MSLSSSRAEKPSFSSFSSSSSTSSASPRVSSGPLPRSGLAHSVTAGSGPGHRSGPGRRAASSTTGSSAATAQSSSNHSSFSSSLRNSNSSSGPGTGASGSLISPTSITTTNAATLGAGASGASAGASAAGVAGLPNTDLGFDALRERMAAFTIKFDDFIDKQKKAVLADRNEFQKSVEAVKEKSRLTSRETESIHRSTAAQTSLLASQRAETEELKQSIHAFSLQRDAASAHRDALLSQLSGLRSSIAAKQASLRANEQVRSAQERMNAPELEFWERYLGMRIETGGGVDRLRFVFGYVSEGGGGGGRGVNGGNEGDGDSDGDDDGRDHLDSSAQAWFELGTGERDYKVLRWEPRQGVDHEDVLRCTEQLNQSRDLAPFLKGMRDLFVRAMREK